MHGTDVPRAQHDDVGPPCVGLLEDRRHDVPVRQRRRALDVALPEPLRGLVDRLPRAVLRDLRRVGVDLDRRRSRRPATCRPTTACPGRRRSRPGSGLVEQAALGDELGRTRGAGRAVGREHDAIDVARDERRGRGTARGRRPRTRPTRAAAAGRRSGRAHPIDDEVSAEPAGLDHDLRRRPTLEDADVDGPITDPEPIGDIDEATGGRRQARRSRSVGGSTRMTAGHGLPSGANESGMTLTTSIVDPGRDGQRGRGRDSGHRRIRAVDREQDLHR